MNDFINALKSDDEFLVIFCLIYSFEREGFDARIDKCKKNCNWFREKTKNRPKSHIVAVLLAINEIKEKYKADSLQELIKIQNYVELAKEVFVKAKEILLKVTKSKNNVNKTIY